MEAYEAAMFKKLDILQVNRLCSEAYSELVRKQVRSFILLKNKDPGGDVACSGRYFCRVSWKSCLCALKKSLTVNLERVQLLFQVRE